MKRSKPPPARIGMTGNAVEIAGDLTRRMVRVDLDAGVERPETREFDFDCEAEARQDRGELIVAALTILRAHALAGWPALPGRGALGSFEDWDRLVAGALTFAGAGDIVSLMDKTRAADPERDGLAEVLRMLQGVGATDTCMKVGEIINAVERKRLANLDDAEAAEWSALLARIGGDGKPNSRRFGRYLTKNVGRMTGGLKLLSELDTHTKVSKYRVSPVQMGPFPHCRANGEDVPCGVSGISGVSESLFLRKSDKNLNTDCVCSSELNIGRAGPVCGNPANPAYPANGSPERDQGIDI